MAEFGSSTGMMNRGIDLQNLKTEDPFDKVGNGTTSGAERRSSPVSKNYEELRRQSWDVAMGTT